MREVFANELLFVLANTGDIEAVTADPNLYFQKLWIYPGKAVSSSTGQLTANGAAVYLGKTGAKASFTPDSLTNDGSKAVVGKTAHGLKLGSSIKVSGSTPSTYDAAVVPIFNVTADRFEYQLLSTPAGPATTLPTIARVQYCPDVLNPTDLPIKFELPLGQKMRLSSVIVTGTAGDGVYLEWS